MTSKVLLITEILQLILLQTDTQTLLLSQRVCRKWHNLIQTSNELRTALFLDPVKCNLPNGVRGTPNPLIAECLNPWFDSYRDSQRKAFQKVAEMLGEDSTGESYCTLSEIDKSFLYERASWRQMLFQQPPRSCFGIFSNEETLPNEVYYAEFDWPDPLRLNDIFGILLTVIERQHDGNEDPWERDLVYHLFKHFNGIVEHDYIQVYSFNRPCETDWNDFDILLFISDEPETFHGRSFSKPIGHTPFYVRMPWDTSKIARYGPKLSCELVV